MTDLDWPDCWLSSTASALASGFSISADRIARPYNYHTELAVSFPSCGLNHCRGMARLSWPVWLVS